MKPLTFSHKFKSGRRMTITVKRKKNTKPVVTSSIQCSELTAAELAEYEPWRDGVVVTMMCILTPGEVL